MTEGSLDIAVIGLACRFPGAQTIQHFWDNLVSGRCSIETKMTNAVASGERVEAFAGLTDIDKFDADFFGISPREAKIIDPQQRILLEIAFEALQDTGKEIEALGTVGVYAGAGTPTYLINQILPSLTRPKECFLGQLEDLLLTVGNDSDYVATRVAHRLNLRGPAITIQTACSTGLVAVHTACQALAGGDCDAALVGASNIQIPQLRSFTYEHGSVASPDGVCRAFDSQAKGTVFGNGVGAIVLMPLAAAYAVGVPIRAVIKGSAINNDGSDKAGFMAPNAEGQAEVVMEALAVSGLKSSKVGYIEAHGTGTLIGDPIEVDGLYRVYGRERERSIALGSVKTNIGHLSWAAGIAGLIKAILAIEHSQIPPTLNFVKPNPLTKLDASPFFINTTPIPWKDPMQRIAGVSAFGIGGTNAHIVLANAKIYEDLVGNKFSVRDTKKVFLTKISANSFEGLAYYGEQLARALSENEKDKNYSIENVSKTLNRSRPNLKYRASIVAGDIVQLREELSSIRVREISPIENFELVFLCTGLGSLRSETALNLYDTYKSIRDTFDEADKVLRDEGRESIIQALYPGQEQYTECLAIGQPATVAFGVALARWWGHLGVHPQVVLGHSLGEYVAAVVAEVISFEDAIRLVARRGQLMDKLTGGAMLSVDLSADNMKKLLKNTSLCLAADNGPLSSVVSGETSEVRYLMHKLQSENIRCRLLGIAGAGHSELMNPIISEFKDEFRDIKLSKPKVKIVSNVTGGFVQNEITDPMYWVRHTLEPVQYQKSIRHLIGLGMNNFVEIGARPILSVLGESIAPLKNWIPSISNPSIACHSLLSATGKLYECGRDIEWENIDNARREWRSLSLPSVPWHRKSYWVGSGDDVDQKINKIIKSKWVDVETENRYVGQKLFIGRGPAEADVVVPTSNFENELEGLLCDKDKNYNEVVVWTNVQSTGVGHYR